MTKRKSGGIRPKAISTDGVCSRCKSPFTFKQRTNRKHYCNPCTKIAAREANTDNVRAKRIKAKQEFVSKLKQVDADHPRVFIHSETGEYYRQDVGADRFVKEDHHQ